nr:cell division protein FtsL [uncultured Acetatifactor sp.]
MARTGRASAIPADKRVNQKRTGRRIQEAYVYGNAVRKPEIVHKPDVRKQLEERPKRQLSNEVRKNRDKARHMNLGYVVFLVGALCAAAFVLVNYVQMQAELTNRINNIASLESELNSLKLANDEEYNRITSSIDLEEIKRVAIGELGMTYAKEGQIITYNVEGNDYMRRVSGNEN